MQAQYSVLHDCTQGEVLEGPVEFVPAGVGFVCVLLESPSALVSEAIDGVDGRVLVVSSDEVNLTRILHLEREEQAYSLEGEASAVHEVTQKEIVHGVDVSVVSVRRCLVPCKEPHEVQILAVDVTIHLDRSSELQDHVLALEDLEHLLTQLTDLGRVEQKPVRVRIRLPRRRLQQVLDDEVRNATGRRGLADVRHDIRVVDFPTLVLQRLDGHLLDEVGEVLLHAYIDVSGHSDVSAPMLAGRRHGGSGTSGTLAPGWRGGAEWLPRTRRA
mmetsp:Transcript_101111/g.324813  ORF Transcript_101111/g.324813 Transcript_101111/m.324813 type:complete len:272 (+) Transcript_101111:693-1508(+)